MDIPIHGRNNANRQPREDRPIDRPADTNQSQPGNIYRQPGVDPKLKDEAKMG